MSSTVTGGGAGGHLQWIVADAVSGLRVYGAPGDSGRRIFAAKPKLLVGKDAQCDVVFDYATVSKVHAVVTRDRSDWVIADNQSKNHVLVDGAVVERAPLVPGSVIEFGDLRCLVESPRVVALRALIARYLGRPTSASSARAVDDSIVAVRWLTVLARHLVLRGPAGSTVALARHLHDTSLGTSWPFFVSASPLRDDEHEQRQLLKDVERGTLCLPIENLPTKNADAFLARVADRGSKVRVIVCVPTSGDVSRVVTALGAASVVDVPELAQRTAELAWMLDETIAFQAPRVGVTDEKVTQKDRAGLATWPWAKYDMATMEDDAKRLLVVRNNSVKTAARKLGVDETAIYHWCKRRGIDPPAGSRSPLRDKPE